MNPQLAKQYFERAEALREAGKPDEALALLNQLDAEFPHTKNIGVARARTYAAMGKIGEAVELCDHLIGMHDSRRAREIKDTLLKSVLEPQAAESSKPAPASPQTTKRAVIKWAVAFALIGVIGLAAYAMLANVERAAEEQLEAASAPLPAAIDSSRPAAHQSADRRAGAVPPLRRAAAPPSKPTPGQIHPKKQWELDDIGLPVWKAGVFRRVNCINEAERTIDVYIPLAYDVKPEMLFPGVVIQMPRGNPGFIGLESWAERQEIILIAVNTSRNGTFSQNHIAQDRALETIVASTLRVDQRLGFAVGMSGGGRASWQLACRYPDNFAGIVMMAISGDEDKWMPPPHVRIAIIHGNTDFNNKGIAYSLKLLRREGYDVREQVFPGGHETGPVEIRVAMLDWMVSGARRDLGLLQPY